ncbi:MAG: hypothetical protein SGI73_23020 [Chloroflexota bacterium]|nr:hypothetical protein [Chloroflexota bacterium]
MQIAFGRLIEAAYDHSSAPTIRSLVDLEDAARDALLGVDWKSDIPSPEQIQAVV